MHGPGVHINQFSRAGDSITRTMGLHKIRKGLDLPLKGAPDQSITEGPRIVRVALMADDFPGLKPRMLIEEGSTVRRGDPLLEDRSIEGVRHTAPGAGRVVAINRGNRRVLQSVVIELSEDERQGVASAADLASFGSYTGGSPEDLSDLQIVDLLVESGQWTAFRTRPFSKVPVPGSVPAAIFVTAMDTHPLSGDPEVVVRDTPADFDLGLDLISRLTEGPTYLCVRPGSSIPGAVTAPVTVEEFAGPHPAGTAGLHIHTLMPVNRNRTVWSIGYQDVIAIGCLFRTGRLCVDRVVAIGGPPVGRPRLIRSRLGAAVPDLTAGETDLPDREVRWISGSVLSGKAARGEKFGYTGRYDVQLSALREGTDREFLGWLSPGWRRFSVLPIYLSKLFGTRRVEFTTSTHGSRRPIVPIGVYERVMPMDIIPTFLLRSLMVGDTEEAEKLGCLELDEEDLALCTFVDPGKEAFGPALRTNLEMIQKEG